MHIIGLSGAHVREGPGLLVRIVSYGCRLVHDMLWILDCQINTTLLLLLRERYIDTVDCLFVGVTAIRGVLISFLSVTFIDAAEVISCAVVKVINISHVDLRLLDPVLNILALGARLFPFRVPLISNNLS